MLKKLKNIAKKLLAVTWIRKTYEYITRAILEVFAANRLFATLYSIPGLLTFNREQYAVLRGRRNYYRNLKKKRDSHVELRRNTHMIEKGITMRPRRPVFAQGYIVETIEFYENAIKQYKEQKDSLDKGELEWAHNVLDEYFTIIETKDAVIDEARERFEQTKVDYNPKVDGMVPYSRAVAEKSDVEYDDILKLAKQRRSVRWYQDKKVPHELVDKALLVARQSPTACNRLPYEFRIFDDPEMVRKVSDIPFGAAGYSHQIPMVVVVTGKLNSYFSPRDRHIVYVDASLASMSFMLALETLGLSSSVINWPDFEPLERKMQKTLHLDADERVIMLISVGYADQEGLIPFSQKKDLSVLRRYNDLGA